MRLLFNESQLKALSQITADTGQVFFASIVVPFLFGLDKVNAGVVLSGLTLTFGCWIVSIFIAGETK